MSRLEKKFEKIKGVKKATHIKRKQYLKIMVDKTVNEESIKADIFDELKNHKCIFSFRVTDIGT